MPAGLRRGRRRGALTEQGFEFHIDRRGALGAVVQAQETVAADLAQHRERAALAGTDVGKACPVGGADDQHVALLRLVAPQFQRRQAGVGAGHRAQVERPAAPGGIDDFRHRVRQPTGADVVDAQDGVVRAQLPAAVDHFLRAALHFRIAALHGVEIEFRRVVAHAQRRGGAAADADAHARTAQLHDQPADGRLLLVHLLRDDVAHAAGQHDRLVIAAHPAADGLLVGAEETSQVGPAELVVEGRRADRAVEHDVQGAHDAVRLAVGPLPGLRQAGQVQVRHHEAGQTRLAEGTAAGGGLVANLAAGAGGGARERRDRRRVVVRLDLGQDVRAGGELPVFAAVRVHHQQARRMAFDHRRVVAVGHQRALRAATVGVADHVEQGQLLRHAVDEPLGVENLVPAVLGVDLREHHQLDVGGVATQAREPAFQVIELVRGQRQTLLPVGPFQRRPAAAEHVHDRQRCRRRGLEQPPDQAGVGGQDLGHAVVQQGRRGGELRLRRRCAGQGQPIAHAVLDAPHTGQTAHGDDVGGLAGPRRLRAGAWQGQHFAGCQRKRCWRALHQRGQRCRIGARHHLGQVNGLGLQAAQVRQHRLQVLLQPGQTKFGQRRPTDQKQRLCHRLSPPRAGPRPDAGQLPRKLPPRRPGRAGSGPCRGARRCRRPTGGSRRG